MKHLLLSCLLLLASFSAIHAQTGPEDQAPRSAFADSITAVFRGVDKARVPSGILEEVGLQFIDHVPFTGTNGYSAANQLDINRWRAIYGDLDGARLNANANSLPSLATVNQQLALYARDAYVELPILHLDYHSIRTDALSSGALRSANNRLYDVAGRNPYQLNTAFAVAASAASLPSATPAFVFRPDLFWTNTGRTVATLQADFADGSGFVALSWNTPRTVSYGSAGDKDVRVRVAYSDGSTYESHLLVRSPAPVAQARYAGTASVTPFTLTAGKAYNGQTASATISVEYGGQRKSPADPAVLDKPLIVVKGFDVSGIIPQVERSTYSSFVQAINSIKSQGILSDGADTDGYDIVYVDFDNGTDYIQRNARLLETVIKWVNDHKTGTQPNTMLAMSMGGLVAQYALREIENDVANAASGAAPHQVRLLITHDAPHQGANVPLSVQMLVRQLAGTSFSLPFGSPIRLIERYPALGQARDALLSPAARQLLRYQTTLTSNLPGAPGFVVAASTSLYDSFQQEYQALLGPTGVPQGTPGQPCRVVASANGSECGRPQPFGPYAMLASLTYEGNAADFKLLDVLDGYGLAAVGAVGAGFGLSAGPLGLVGLGIGSLFALGLTGAYDLTAAFNLRALPDQQARPVCDVFLQVNKRTRLFGLFRVQVTLLEYHGYSLASQLPLDSGSGGIISLAAYAQQLGSAATSLPPGLLQQQQFCFTPTFSTLNITPTSSAALTAQYSPGTNVGTPFANFRTAGRENEQHLDYTALNSNWMLRELRQTPQVLSCQAFCAANPTLSGPDVVCAGSGSTFTVSGVPAGTLVTWSFATTASVSTSASTGSSYTVTSTGATGSGTVQATISSDCGQLTLAKQVIVGKPNPLVRKTSAAGEPTTYEFTAPFVPGATYRWYRDNVLIEDETSNVLLYYFPCKATRTISYAFANDCATTGTRPGATLTGECTRRTAMALYPNPAADEVTAGSEDDAPAARSSAEAPAAPADAGWQISQVRLYDAYGKLRLQQPGHGARAVRIPLQALPAGLYMVQVISQQGTVSRQQLQIKR